MRAVSLLYAGSTAVTSRSRAHEQDSGRGAAQGRRSIYPAVIMSTVVEQLMDDAMVQHAPKCSGSPRIYDKHNFESISTELSMDDY